MKYDLYVEGLDDFGHDYGAEICPPVGELAAQGICRVLMQQPTRREQSFPFVESAVMTRNDRDGTALVIHPTEGSTPTTSEDVAFAISVALDPASLNKITRHFK